MYSQAFVNRQAVNSGDGLSEWRKLGKAPFVFRHSLNDHPLFEISQLAKMAEIASLTRPRSNVGLAISNASMVDDESFGSNTDTKGLPLNKRFAAAFESLSGGTYWIKLSALQDLHPDYRAFLHDVFVDLEEAAGAPLRKSITWSGLTVFLSSPNFETPYHFDHDMNFLFQIRGNKDVHVFDPSIVTQNELERFYRGDGRAGKYREDLAGKDQVFRLSPGEGAHHPSLAPHIVRNGNNVSVSLSVYYTNVALDARARVYQANYCLRSLGFNPRPPGQSALSDRLKIQAFQALSKRRPNSWREVVYSGVDRLFLPSKIVNWAMRKARRSLSA